MSDDLNKKEVVLLSAHKEALDSIMGDVKGIRDHVDNELASSGVKMSEHADLLAKTTEQLEEVGEKLASVQTEVAEFRAAANVYGGDNELRAELKSFGAGFQTPGGNDDQYAKFGQGSKPTVKALVNGAMLEDGTFHVSKHEDVARMQKLHDDAMIIDAVKRVSGDRDSYLRKGGIASLSQVAEMRSIGERLQKAATDMVDTTDLSNWVPTHFSPQLYEIVRAGLPELNVFQEITMPGKNMDLNVDLTEYEAAYVAEVTSNANANPFSDTTMQALTDSKVTLAAKKLRSRIVFSGEVEEDAIVPQLALYRRGVIRGFQEGLADAIINGDEAATGDLDNTTSSRTHFGKACPAAGTDARRIFDGLRSFVADNAATPDTFIDHGGGDITAAAVVSMLAKMGEWGANPQMLALFTSYVGHANMLDDTDFKTIDVMGDRATLLTGQIGSMFGIPIFVSRRYPVNLTNSDGKIAATTDSNLRTGAILVNRDAVVVGNRRRLTLETERYVATDTNEIVAFWRGDMEDLFGTAYPWIAGLYDVGV